MLMEMPSDTDITGYNETYLKVILHYIVENRANTMVIHLQACLAKCAGYKSFHCRITSLADVSQQDSISS